MPAPGTTAIPQLVIWSVGELSMTLRFWRALMVLGFVAGCSCGTATEPSRLPAGVWGGDHISMTVGDTSTHFELDCGHGDLPAAPTVDRQRQFEIAGNYVHEHGGPIRQGEIPETHPAIYSGTVASTTMTLTIRLSDTKESIGPFTLVSGSLGRVLKCL
jgi:hypothetical protein